MTLWDTPTFKYRHKTKKLVEPLYQIENFASYSATIILKNNQHLAISSAPKVTLPFIHRGLHRAHTILQYDFVKRKRVIFPQEYSHQDSLQRSITQEIEGMGIQRGYSFTRLSQDCCILVSVNMNNPVEDRAALYYSTIDSIEAFTSDFFDEMLPVYCEGLPQFLYSRTSEDQAYRHRVIKTRCVSFEDITLHDSELGILYWSAQGKTAEEIGQIMGHTKNTIDSYRRQLLDKMQVRNIVQAVYLGTSLGLIT